MTMPPAALPLLLLLAAALPAAGAAQRSAGGQGAGAFDAAAEGLKAAPSDTELFLIAVENLPDGSPSRARLLSEAAAARLKADAGDYAAHLGACRVLRSQGRPQEAAASCRKALELEPTAYPVYRELGLAYAAAGSARKAAETLAQGVEISSGDYKAHFHLAKFLEGRGDAPRAKASYGRALALAGRDSTPEGARYRSLAEAGLKRTAAKSARDSAPGSPAGRQRFEACMARVREDFLRDNLGLALQQSDECLKLSPADPRLAAERAPLLVRLGRQEEGAREYERAAGLAADAQEASRLRVKAAETWHKLSRDREAAAQYAAAAKAAPLDAGALRAYAGALEAVPDHAGAAAAYDDLLKLDPSDERARTRRDELKASALSDPEVLQELKDRLAVPKEKTAASPEDLKLFARIRAAELGGAVDYIRRRQPSTPGLVVKPERKGAAKVALTAAGYRAYVTQATRDAVKFFEAEKIGMREIFQLRNETGAPVFEKSGRLTPEGEELWRKSVPGKKTWLMPYDAVPSNPQAVKAERDISEARGQGYEEISEPEYLWLLRATDCPEDVMAKDPVFLRIFSDGARRRYLLCYVPNSLCMNPVNEKLPPYIARYRSGDDHISKEKFSTSFFGSRGSRKYRFCEDGKIWGGDVKVPDPLKVDGPR